MKQIKITLETRSYGSYRVARLVGAISITGRTKTKNNLENRKSEFESEYHVGDVVSEFTAKDLAASKSYEVTVVPAK